MTEISMFASFNLFYVAFQVLESDSIQEKISLSNEACRLWDARQLTRNADDYCPQLKTCGRPSAPRLVNPRDLPKRSVATRQGQAALIHAIAHIEFNAINLAWDAVYRYRNLPGSYYHDWLKVAAEETRHFQLLNQRLSELDYKYGDFQAHAGLWDMAEKTAHNFLERMAVIPRGMEARGLDVTPGLINRLRQVGDLRTVEILELILEDEIGHVAIGDRWFRYACDKAGCKPESMYREIVSRYSNSPVQGPFNREARVQAGFTHEELDRLVSWQKQKPE